MALAVFVVCVWQKCWHKGAKLAAANTAHQHRRAKRESG